MTQLEIKELTGQTHVFPVKAYAVDKPVSSNGPTLQNEYRMGNFHCCDYFLVNENNVLLLEDSNLKEKKNDLEKRCLCYVQDEEIKKKFSAKIIKKEQVLKAYASLLLLCNLISQDRNAKKLMKNKEVHFCIVINDVDMSESHAFDNLSASLIGSLGPIISDVVVVPLGEASRIFRKYSNFNP